MAIMVQHMEYEMKFGMEIYHVEQLYKMHVYVPKHRIS
jgi:hypothetical protein